MKIRVEAFVQGFMTSLKPQMTHADRAFLNRIFQNYRPYSESSEEERNPAKAAHYFRFRYDHLNVLLPVWLLNGRASTASERFRIAFTEDRSYIYDVKESILYDPTGETLHSLPEYRLFLGKTDWRAEAAAVFREELKSKSLIVCSVAERLQQLPILKERSETERALVEAVIEELRVRSREQAQSRGA